MALHETPPAVAPALDWTFPAGAETVLDNGLRLLTYNCPGQHVVASSLVFDVPLTAEPRELEGVAGLTGRCLTKGAAGRSAEAFADELALRGADLAASASLDAFTVRLSAPSTRLATSLDLMADTVRSPLFDDAEFKHEQRLRLQEIDQANAYPQHVAVEHLNAALFGSARAARPTGGLPDTVKAVGRDDVVAFAATHLHPSNATLIIAGDFTSVDPVEAAQASFGNWDASGRAAPAGAPPEASTNGQVILIDWPDAPQATLRLAGPGISRADALWPALFVANYAVGGNFSSRINTVLREQKGVTYGANSSMDTARGEGLVTVSTAVRSEATAESLADIVSILADSRGTLTDDEVSIAVRAASDSAALGFERADAVVSRVETLLSERLDLDHVDRNLARIRAVSTEAANEAYTAVVEPHRLPVVVAGDAASLREPLESWGYADVREVSV